MQDVTNVQKKAVQIYKKQPNKLAKQRYKKGLEKWYKKKQKNLKNNKLTKLKND